MVNILLKKAWKNTETSTASIDVIIQTNPTTNSLTKLRQHNQKQKTIGQTQPEKFANTHLCQAKISLTKAVTPFYE